MPCSIYRAAFAFLSSLAFKINKSLSSPHLVIKTEGDSRDTASRKNIYAFKLWTYWEELLFHVWHNHIHKLLIINYSSQKAKTEAHGAHKCHRVASFGLRQVLSTPKMHKKFHGHRVKPVGTR